MPMSPEDKKKLINLGLSTGGGAGLGALLEYMTKGHVGWMGPTGGALAGGGAYAAYSPEARAALRRLVGWKTDAEKARAVKAQKNIVNQAALSTFIEESGYPPEQIRTNIQNFVDVNRRLPTTQELSKNFSVSHAVADSVLNSGALSDLGFLGAVGMQNLFSNVTTPKVPGVPGVLGKTLGVVDKYVGAPLVYGKKVYDFGAGMLSEDVDRAARQRESKAIEGGEDSFNYYMNRKITDAGTDIGRTALMPFMNKISPTVGASMLPNMKEIGRTYRYLDPAIAVTDAVKGDKDHFLRGKLLFAKRYLGAIGKRAPQGLEVASETSAKPLNILDVQTNYVRSGKAGRKQLAKTYPNLFPGK